MSNRSSSTSTPKALVRRPNGVKDLDPNDPDDNAFVLVIEFVFYCDVLFFKKNSFFCPFFSSIALFLRPPGPTNLTSSSSQATRRGQCNGDGDGDGGASTAEATVSAATALAQQQRC
jgi:hypothetical protein